MSDFDLDEHLDRGSWARFTPSLAQFLAAHPHSVLLLTAPAPVVAPQDIPSPGLLRRICGARRSSPSPDQPGLVLTIGAQTTQLALPVLDAQGRYLLGASQCSYMTTAGWESSPDVLTLRTGHEEAAQGATRVLIEVLNIPHPADCDWLFQELSSSHAASPDS